MGYITWFTVRRRLSAGIVWKHQNVVLSKTTVHTGKETVPATILVKALAGLPPAATSFGVVSRNAWWQHL